jgi:hypothetical protein
MFGFRLHACSFNHALADEDGSEDGDEHRVLICLGQAPVA